MASRQSSSKEKHKEFVAVANHVEPATQIMNENPEMMSKIIEGEILTRQKK